MELLTNISLSLAGVFSLFTAQAQAQQVPECFSLYNSGVTCQTSELISIDKKIQNPSNNEFVDILEPNQAAHEPGDAVVFRITVTNTGNAPLEEVTFIDRLPHALTFVSSEYGAYNQNPHNITYTIPSLQEEETVRIDVHAQIKQNSELPQSPNPLCLTNISTVAAENQEATDNVQFCITREAQEQEGEKNATSFPIGNQTPQQTNGQSPQTDSQTTKGGKQVHPAPESETSPNTGPELLTLLGLLPGLGAGFYLRKKSTK